MCLSYNLFTIEISKTLLELIFHFLFHFLLQFLFHFLFQFLFHFLFQFTDPGIGQGDEQYNFDN